MSDDIQTKETENLEIQDPGVIHFKRAEWCYQFDDETPIVFAWSQEENDPGHIVFKLEPRSNSNLYFRSVSGKEMKIFSREITEPTLKTIAQNGEIDTE